MDSQTTWLFYALWTLISLHVLIVWSRAWCLGSRARQSPLPELSLQSTPFVSILIPAWKEQSTLKATLTALQQLTYPTWEAIVIAGGPDGTEVFARKVCKNWSRFTVIPQPPFGKNAALNLGYAQASGEVIVLLDADCVVQPEWLAHLVAPLTQGYDAALGSYFATKRTWVSDLFEMEKISAYHVHCSEALNGRGGIALRRSVIESLGGFPEMVTVGVDWDLDLRVTRLGARKIYVPEARNATYMPMTLRRYFRDEVRWRRAHLQATARFFEWNPAGLRTVAVSLSFYAVGLVFFAVPFIGVALAPFAPWILQVWLAFWVWVILRRIGLGLEIVTYTRDWYWRRRIWVPPVLLIASFLSGIVALLTVRRNPVFFQGPRPQMI